MTSPRLDVQEMDPLFLALQGVTDDDITRAARLICSQPKLCDVCVNNIRTAVRRELVAIAAVRTGRQDYYMAAGVWLERMRFLADSLETVFAPLSMRFGVPIPPEKATPADTAAWLREVCQAVTAALDAHPSST